MQLSSERWGGCCTCTQRTTAQGARTPGRNARACRGGHRRLSGCRRCCRHAPSIISITLPLHRPSPSITVAVASPSCHSVAVVAAYHRLLLLIPLLVGCCVVFRCPISSLHAVMQPPTLLMRAACAANCCPPPPPLPPPQLLLPPGRHHRHCHHRG